MGKLLLAGLMISVVSIGAYSQQQNYIGAGHNNNIIVTSSSDFQLYDGPYTASAQKTIDGSGLEGPKMEAARFLSQATFGGTRSEIDALAESSIEDWLDNQFSTPTTYISDSVQLAYDMAKANYVANGGDPNNYTSRPSWRHFDYAWWTNAMTAKDQLRQRMAYALSEILVISTQGQLSNYGMAIGEYYDVLLDNAFANFKNLLFQVTMSVPMGVYLSHLNNPKTNVAANIHPDENYAREIMQLFSIGLYKLNIDGSIQLDANGVPIPTYNNNDIKELAKIFTGLGVGQRTDGGNLYFYLGIGAADFSVPMKMYEDYHEQGSKTILDNYFIPSNQTGIQDIVDAIDHLYNHPNVGPFLAKRLIQHFVKSNPTPSYIQSVAEKFNDNGSGLRGDLTAVLREILTHPEARECTWINDPSQGKLREPALRFTQFARYFKGTSPHEGRFWNYGSFFRDRVSQHPLHSPTVFNFFGPDYMPGGPLSNANLLGPEFEIHNTNTSIGYADMVYYWVESELLFISYSSDALNSNVVVTDLSKLVELSKDMDALLDHMDLILCNGQLSDHTRQIIKNKLNEFPAGLNYLESKIRLATYMIMISPDYVILK